MNMNLVEFERDSSFFLCSKEWGAGNVNDVIAVLCSCRRCFLKNLDKAILPQKACVVIHSAYDYPWIKQHKMFDEIFLDVRDRFWSQYAYQFAHELCHHVIDSVYDETSRFGWLEEALCELASLYCLRKMAEEWNYNPPYENWRDYSGSLSNYANSIIDCPDNHVEHFNEWLNQNLPSLYINRYERDLNRIVAVKLFALFFAHPRMWRLIQYLANVKYDNTLSLVEYFRRLSTAVPPGLRRELDDFVAVFVD